MKLPRWISSALLLGPCLLVLTQCDGSPGNDPMEPVIRRDVPVARDTAGGTAPLSANRYTDFSSYATGVRPNDWSEPYSSGGFAVEQRAGTTGGKVLFSPAATNRNYVLRWDPQGTLDDVELETVARVVPGNAGNDGMGLVIRGNAGQQTFYATRYDHATARWHISKYVNGSATTLSRLSRRFDQGSWVRQKFRVERNTLRAKFWADGTTEPAAWSLEARDDSNPLPPGFVGVFVRRSGTATDYDYFLVSVLNESSPNQPPTANFGYTADGLKVTFVDSSADADGTVTAWAWSFGDGKTGTERNATHSYAASGSYTVRLTVTDDQGADAETTQTLTVTAPSSTAVLIGAGDIAGCGKDSHGIEYQSAATGALLDLFPEATVFTAGDNAYPNGTAEEYANCYGPTWGRHRARTRPSAGNHEYYTPGATPYYDYFGANAGEPGKGYYSYRAGSWHVVVLNSNIDMAAGSPQEQWLRADLAANPTRCTLAYWHHPRFSSGGSGLHDIRLKPFWDALYDAGAELVLASHDHVYERFAQMRPDGVQDTAKGIRQITIGTGGARLYPFYTIHGSSQLRNNQDHGILKLTLEEDAYSWEFIPVAGKSFTDSGRTACH